MNAPLKLGLPEYVLKPNLYQHKLSYNESTFIDWFYSKYVVISVEPYPMGLVELQNGSNCNIYTCEVEEL